MESCPTGRLGIESDTPAVQFDNGLGDTETKARAGLCSVSGVSTLTETLEDAISKIFRDSGSAVADCNAIPTISWH